MSLPFPKQSYAEQMPIEIVINPREKQRMVYDSPRGLFVFYINTLPNFSKDSRLGFSYFNDSSLIHIDRGYCISELYSAIEILKKMYELKAICTSGAFVGFYATKIDGSSSRNGEKFLVYDEKTNITLLVYRLFTPYESSRWSEIRADPINFHITEDMIKEHEDSCLYGCTITGIGIDTHLIHQHEMNVEHCSSCKSGSAGATTSSLERMSISDTSISFPFKTVSMDASIIPPELWNVFGSPKILTNTQIDALLLKKD
jgi:hypothetical protein